MIFAATTLYTVQALREIEREDLVGYPAFFYGYALAWIACGLALLAGIFMFIKGCKGRWEIYFTHFVFVI